VSLYSVDAASAAVAAHCDGGGQAVLARDGRLILAGGGNEVTLLEPATLARCARREVDAATALAAAACAVALGVSPEVLRTGFNTFDADRATDRPNDRGTTPHLSVAASAR